MKAIRKYFPLTIFNYWLITVMFAVSQYYMNSNHCK
jgi:hypothetical protein